MSDPLTVKCPACDATIGYPCMNCIVNQQANIDCWEVTPHSDRIKLAAQQKNP